MSELVIIDYGLCNLNSVLNAVDFLGCKAVISSNPKDIEASRLLILPGVGAFGEAMKNLNSFGLIDVLNDAVMIKKKPILGICLGFQLFANLSEEQGQHVGLGWIDGEVTRLKISGNLRLPHIGWNNISTDSSSLIFREIPDPNFYFVHSFAFHEVREKISMAFCEYGNKFVAAIHKDNIVGTQFHPEKSHVAGLKLLQNFISFANQYNA